MNGKKLRKNLSPVLFISLSGAILAGCGTSGSSSTSTTSNNTSNQASKNQTSSSQTSNNTSQSSAQTTSANGPLKIIMWVNPPAVAAVKKIDKEFETKYGVTVQLQTAANDTAGYQTLQQSAVQASTADIMAIQPFDPMPNKMNSNNLSKTQEWAINNVFQPLNDQPWVSQFQKSYLDAASYKGQYYGLVTGVYQTGIFYNKAIFKKYNLQPPQTYDAFIKLCKTLKSHKVTPVWTGLAGGATFYTEFMMYPILQDLFAPSLGSQSVSQALASGKVKWSNPKMLTVFQREKGLASNYLEKNYAGQNWQQMPGDFAAGKAAMLLDGSWDLSSVLKANPKMQIGYFPLPGSNTAADNKSVANADLTWTILKSSKNKALAEKWLTFFASKTSYGQYVKMTGISPSENGSYQSPTGTIMGKWFGTGRLINQTANWLIPNGPYYMQSKNFWAEQLKMLQGGISPNKLIQEYQKSQDQAVK